MSDVQLRSLDFGKLDARHELLLGTISKTEGQPDDTSFRETYVIPRNVDIDHVFDKKISFVTGLKGIGKTALLHFLKSEASIRGIRTEFIFFKRELNEGGPAEFFARVGILTYSG